MENNLMEPNRTLSNTDEILQHVKHAAELPNISPEKKAVLDKASTEVQDILRTYFTSIEKISAESLPVSTTPEISPTPETHQYTLSDLEKIGINPGERFQTPLEDGTSTVREVSFAGSGIVVLSNTDTTKYGVLDEIYTPDQYGILAEKVFTGVYTPAITNSTAVVTPIITGTSPVESASVEIFSQTSPEPAHRRSLAELLGQGELTPVNTTTVPGISTTETTPEKPNIKTDDTLNPTPVTLPSSLVETPVSVETTPIRLLPVSLDHLAKIENSLKNDRPHQSTYIFLAGALQKSWIKTIPKSDPIPTMPVSERLDVLPTPAPAPTTTSTGTSKLDAASMFNN